MPLTSHVELSPTLFLGCAEEHFALRTAVLDGQRSLNYGELADRVPRRARHPSGLDAAVLGRPDPRWGEVPVAFVTPRGAASPDPQELIDFVRARTARFKVPKAVIFRELPKTSTGKGEEHRLREELQAPATAKRGLNGCPLSTRHASEVNE